MQRRHGWTVERDWILTGPGVVPSLNFIVQTYTDVGDNVLISTPVYHPFYSCVENNERNLVFNPLLFDGKRYDLDFDDLEAKLADEKTKLYIVCSPHNPVGRIWTKDELRRMAELCMKHNVLLLSDEIHHDLIYPEAKLSRLASPAPKHSTTPSSAPHRARRLTFPA